MEITKQQLIRAVPGVYQPRLDEVVAALNMWGAHYGIDTPVRMALPLAVLP